LDGGDEKGVGIFREDIKEGAFNNRASDRLLHMEEVDQANSTNIFRRVDAGAGSSCRPSSFMGALYSSRPWFAKLATSG